MNRLHQTLYFPLPVEDHHTINVLKQGRNYVRTDPFEEEIVQRNLIAFLMKALGTIDIVHELAGAPRQTHITGRMHDNMKIRQKAQMAYVFFRSASNGGGHWYSWKGGRAKPKMDSYSSHFQKNMTHGFCMVFAAMIHTNAYKTERYKLLAAPPDQCGTNSPERPIELMQNCRTAMIYVADVIEKTSLKNEYITVSLFKGQDFTVHGLELQKWCLKFTQMPDVLFSIAYNVSQDDLGTDPLYEETVRQYKTLYM